MSLEKEISTGIMEAMKAKNPVRLSALRNVKKYIIEAKTAGPEIAELPDADVIKSSPSWPSRGAIRRPSMPSSTVRTWPTRSWRRLPCCRSSCPSS